MLTFWALKYANSQRGRKFVNRRGVLIDCSNWILPQWSNALAGETGELCNIIKHIDIGDYTLAEGFQKLSDEFGDVQAYLDLSAQACGIDLEKATRDKFNAVSDRIGSDVRL